MPWIRRQYHHDTKGGLSMENSNCGFTVEKGLKYLKCCGILDECARDCFDTFKYEIDYKKVETLFSFLCLSGDETAIIS